MRAVLVLVIVNCVIGLSRAAVNSTCSATTACDDAKNEVCENGYCKIKIEGTCEVEQTQPTTTAPVQAQTTAPTAAPGQTSAPTPTTGQTADPGQTEAPTPDPGLTEAPEAAPAEQLAGNNERKRRAAPATMTMPPMTNKQECVENSWCRKPTGSTEWTCQCKDGYDKDDNGFCEEAKSSASSLRFGIFTFALNHGEEDLQATVCGFDY
ncbi:skin secretory protein xP2-like [Mya arenaria]|uniref:skin secretory protein xP2-like n=1 Tax=Mya arenaria TaxID=6604 RepID=UPI0022E6573A|nr:skin secretory protein xP2-like [Mya arenaria]